MKNKKKIEGVRLGVGGQGGCVRRIEVIVKCKKKKNRGEGGGGVRSGMGEGGSRGGGWSRGMGLVGSNVWGRG